MTCSAVTPCPLNPPQLTWNHHHSSAITETNPDGTIVTKITQNITLTDSDDGQLINCSAVYPVSGGFKTEDSNITLNVTCEWTTQESVCCWCHCCSVLLSSSDGPKNTLVKVSPSGPLSAGQSVTLSCSSRANPPVQTFTWFTLSSSVSVSEGHNYTFNLTEDTHFYCVASNELRNHSSPIFHLSVTGINLHTHTTTHTNKKCKLVPPLSCFTSLTFLYQNFKPVIIMLVWSFWLFV